MKVSSLHSSSLHRTSEAQMPEYEREDHRLDHSQHKYASFIYQ